MTSLAAAVPRSIQVTACDEDRWEWMIGSFQVPSEHSAICTQKAVRQQCLVRRDWYQIGRSERGIMMELDRLIDFSCAEQEAAACIR